MRSMVLERSKTPLVPAEVAQPEPSGADVLLDIHACAVCRTDLHIADGELVAPRYPLTPGHQIVATVAAAGPEAVLDAGARVGVPWLAWVDGDCRYCRSNRENLCINGKFTGLDRDGGYATAALADSHFCLPLPEELDDVHAAPLLCGGLIGFRAYRRVGDAERVGFYGFGSAAHMISQVAVYEGRRVFAFTSPGDTETQEFACELGAVWAGGSDESPPEELDAAVIFAPVGPLVPVALRAVAPGGPVICAGIHMSDIPSFPYEILWGERSVVSIANLTRQDGYEFLEIARQARVEPHVTTYPLESANEALDDLRNGRFRGTAVLLPN